MPQHAIESLHPAVLTEAVTAATPISTASGPNFYQALQGLRFIQQVPTGKSRFTDKPIGDINQLRGQLPGNFTLSFLYDACGTGQCQVTGAKLANLSSKDPSIKHVIISALPMSDHTGVLWNTLSAQGLRPKNTIVLYPTSNGQVSGIPFDGKMTAYIQHGDNKPAWMGGNPRLGLPTLGDGPQGHSGMINTYNADGNLIAQQNWQQLGNAPARSGRRL